MQEYGWTHWNKFWEMIHALEGFASCRKLRLAACACVRHVVVNAVEVPILTESVNLAEQFSDFRASKEQLRGLRNVIAARIEEERLRVVQDKGAMPAWVTDSEGADSWAYRVQYELPHTKIAWCAEALLTTRKFGLSALREAVRTAIEAVRLEPGLDEERARCDLLRDIFGNPFRPITFDPGWRTDTAVSLAKQMYDARDFSVMPILADALQDAGCEQPDTLAHCRTDGPHVRGCWVVDLVLGKQ